MPAIRRTINIATSPRTVWRALTTAEGLQSWWADEARVDGREGGHVVITSEDDEGNPVEERGMFHTFRPIRKIELAFDSNSPGPLAGTRVMFQVARDGDETRINLVHSGSGPLDDEEARDALDTDWRRALKALRSGLED